jgi:hypothetical protein
VERLRSKEGLNYADFKELLADMDTLMRSLPPTAQVQWVDGWMGGWVEVVDCAGRTVAGRGC